jgi:hypothetical protein
MSRFSSPGVSFGRSILSVSLFSLPVNDERHLVILVVDRRAGVGADVEVLVLLPGVGPLQTPNNA